MSFEITGKLHKKFDTEKVSDRFQKREFVLNFDDNGYEQIIKFQLTQDKCNLIDKIQEGEEVKVLFNLKGREYTNRDGKTMYFTNLDAWKLETANSSSPEKKGNGMPDFPEPPDSAYNQAPPEQDDDLPF